MKRNIGEFSWVWLIVSIVLCLAPAVCVYRLFSFQRSAPKTDVTPGFLDLQRQLDELKRKCAIQTPPKITIPTAENKKSSEKR